jgi:hypothetical protein
MSDITVSISIPLDDNGMMGRECLECERYFKLKPGTGLETDHTYCPYCDYHGNSNTFWTKSQLEYAKSIAMKEAFRKIVKPSLNKLERSFKQLERSSRNSLIQFKVKSTGNNFIFPIKYYSEEELETKIACDNCGLEFSIYGVFSTCPDCNEINAFLIYDKSLDVINKKIEIFSKREVPEEIVEMSLGSVISSCVSAFDGLGKELRKRKPDKYPKRPNNLFQNLFQLNKELNNLISENHSEFSSLLKLFQVRHLNEHNMGVIDDDFINKIPNYGHLKGRKYKLEIQEVHNFLNSMKELGTIVKKHFEE